jgi:hypothetical protein
LDTLYGILYKLSLSISSQDRSLVIRCGYNIPLATVYEQAVAANMTLIENMALIADLLIGDSSFVPLFKKMSLSDHVNVQPQKGCCLGDALKAADDFQPLALSLFLQHLTIQLTVDFA